MFSCLRVRATVDNEPQYRSHAIEVYVRTEVTRRNRSFRALASSPRFVEERRRRLVVQQFFRSVGVALLSMSNRNNFCYSVLPSHREYVRRNDEAPRSLDLPCLSDLRMLVRRVLASRTRIASLLAAAGLLEARYLISRSSQLCARFESRARRLTIRRISSRQRPSRRQK